MRKAFIFASSIILIFVSILAIVYGQGGSLSDPVMVPVGGGIYLGSLPVQNNFGCVYNATLPNGVAVNVTLLTYDTDWKLMIYGPSSSSPLVPPGIIGDSNRTNFVYAVNGWPGNYSIEVYRNSLAQGDYSIIISMSLVGDVNNDGMVDMRDIGIICDKFGLTPVRPLWDPKVDTNGDGIVDMRDIGIAVRNFGKTYP
jgi:hypothetical protein